MCQRFKSPSASRAIFSPERRVVPQDGFHGCPRARQVPPRISRCMLAFNAASETASSSLRAEHDELGTGLYGWHVTGWHVVGVAGFDDFLVVAVSDCYPTGEHVAPVRALAAVAWQSFQQRREVSVLPDRGEVDGVFVEMVGPVFCRSVVDDLGGAVSGYSCHRLPFFCSGSCVLQAAISQSALVTMSATRLALTVWCQCVDVRPPFTRAVGSASRPCSVGYRRRGPRARFGPP